MNNIVKKALKEAFGESASLIHFDEKSDVVLSQRIKRNEKEYMVHKFSNGILLYGFYTDSFDDAILKYLEKKEKRCI